MENVAHGPQSIKYLLFHPSEERLADLVVDQWDSIVTIYQGYLKKCLKTKQHK